MGRLDSWRVSTRIQLLVGLMLLGLLALCVVALAQLRDSMLEDRKAKTKNLPEVEQGVQLAGAASEALRAIENGAERTLARVREVAEATHEQGSASTSIAQRVEQIAQMVEETTATIRGTAETANQLEQIALRLRGQIARFKV